MIFDSLVDFLQDMHLFDFVNGDGMKAILLWQYCLGAIFRQPCCIILICCLWMESEIVFGSFLCLPKKAKFSIESPIEVSKSVCKEVSSLNVFKVSDPKISKDSFDLGILAHLCIYNPVVKPSTIPTQVLLGYNLDLFDLYIPNLFLFGMNVYLPTYTKM